MTTSPVTIGGDATANVIISGSGNVVYAGARDMPRWPQFSRYLRMLAVIASPVANPAGDGDPDGATLDVWGEWERLCNAVSSAHDAVAGRTAAWAIVRLTPPSLEVLGDALAAGRAATPYQVVHFSCHGWPGGVVLEDDLGREAPASCERLAEVVRGTGVQLIILNACQTHEVARYLVREVGIPCVIATRDSIFDDEAQLLAERLYSRLAAGDTVCDALEAARRSLADAYARGDLSANLRDVPSRLSILQLEGDGTVRLHLQGQDTADRPRFILSPTRHTEPLPFGKLVGFVGRARELLEIGQWFHQTGQRAFALSGVGGVGKTALALNAALRHAHRFDVMAFARADTIPDFGLQHVADLLNAALDRTYGPNEECDLRGAVARRLNEAAVLLVLDNLESLGAEQTRELALALDGLDPRGRSRVLMTLRPRVQDPLTALRGLRQRRLECLDEISSLRLAWEALYRKEFTDKLQPEPSADPHLKTLGKQARLGWLPLPYLAALHHMARAAFFHPYFIWLAIGMLQDHDWADMLLRLEGLRGQEIQDALDNLIGQMLGDLERKSPASLQALYAALPFVVGATESRLRYVLLGEDVPDESDRAINTFDSVLLPALKSNLLARSDARGSGHYTLDAPVRAYLQTRHPPAQQDWFILRLRHAQAHLPIVADYDDALRKARMTYSAPLEWPDVTAVFDFLAESVSDPRAARLLVAFAQHWRNTLYNGYHPRRWDWLQAAWQAAQQVGTPQERANVLQAQGDVLAFQKQNDEALGKYEAALALFKQVGDRLGEANVLQAQGDLLRGQAQFDRAWQVYENALTGYQSVGDSYSCARVYYRQGDWHAEQSHWLEAIELYQKAAAIWQSIGLPDLVEQIIQPRMDKAKENLNRAVS